MKRRRFQGLPQTTTRTNAEPNRIGFTNLAGFVFNIASLVVIDLVEYEQGKPGRRASLTVLGPVTKEFVDSKADEVYLWYLEISGQTRIQPANRIVT